jgi:HEAT repeat protein
MVRTWAALALMDWSSENAEKAAACLQELSPEHKADAVSILMEVLGYPNWVARIRAARQLGWLSPEAETATQALVKALEDEQPDVRAWAAWAIWKVNRGAADSLAVLIGVIKEERAAGTVDPLRTGKYLLGQIGKEAEPGLQKILEEAKDDSTREAVREALQAINAQATTGPAEGMERDDG